MPEWRTDKERREVVELAKQLDLLHESTTSSEEPDPKTLYQRRCAHMQFHTRIAEYAELPFLTQQIEKNQLLVFNWFYDHQLYSGRKLSAQWHEQLVRSFAEGSEELADAATRWNEAGSQTRTGEPFQQKHVKGIVETG